MMDFHNGQWDRVEPCHEPIDGAEPGVRAVAELVRTLRYFNGSLPTIRIEEDILKPARWCSAAGADDLGVLCDAFELLFERLLISAGTSVASYLAGADGELALEYLRVDIERINSVVGKAYRGSLFRAFKVGLEKEFSDARF